MDAGEGLGTGVREDDGSSRAGAAVPGTSPLSPGGRGAGGEGDDVPVRIAVPAHLEARMIEVARGFRKAPTPSEARLWELVRGGRLGVRFRRQQPIGSFVVDFFCPRHRLIVEVDGAVHAGQAERDRERQQLLEACGYRVLRLTATEVERDPSAAREAVRAVLEERLEPSPPGPLSLKGRGGEGTSP